MALDWGALALVWNFTEYRPSGAAAQKGRIMEIVEKETRSRGVKRKKSRRRDKKDIKRETTSQREKQRGKEKRREK